MAKSSTGSPRGPRRKAIDPEARENQLISRAMDLAEKQLIDGTASSQVITHFLKLATTKAELEKEKLKKENKLMDAKTKQIESSEEIKVLYENAIKAMSEYQGRGEIHDWE